MGLFFLIRTQISLHGRSGWRLWLWSGSPRRWGCGPQSLCSRSQSLLWSPHHLSETGCPRSAGFLLCTLLPPVNTRKHTRAQISMKPLKIHWKKKNKKHPSGSKAVNMVCNLHVKCIILYCIEAIHDAFITHFTFFIAHFFSCMNTQCSRRGAIKRKKGNIWTSALKAGWQEDNYSVSVTFPTKTQSVICGFLSACFYYCCTVARIQAAVSCWSILTTTYIHFDI